MKATVFVCLMVGVLLATSSVRSAPQESEYQVWSETGTVAQGDEERLTITDNRACQSGYYRDFLGRCRKIF
ncbi:hypothetical protein GHT06_010942 [Daphnia sinensis]|uniref:Uncharacterized protein n=1 Tax=Daphnia sinensis TaxID=1820382 RepID=A0AAD5KZ47_9CRUS|nr:hypothetical protein GHT06_010942 [Daphnia sinensis]